MAREHNLLLGHGETLTTHELRKSGGGAKHYPYSFEEQKEKLSGDIKGMLQEMKKVPPDAFPEKLAVASMTMHPDFLAKSYFPEKLMESFGFKAVGSRTVKNPLIRKFNNKGGEEITTERFFVAGNIASFERWSVELPNWGGESGWQKEILGIESLELFPAEDKLRSLPETDENTWFEVVLHSAKNPKIAAAFIRFASERQIDVSEKLMRDHHGLTFVPIHMSKSKAKKLAQFSFLRVARQLPHLRPFDPPPTRAASSFPIVLPDGGVLDRDLKQ
ncbi:MAG: hypothetical protein A2527_10135 [Candidatus Lambdaproteobacteria bacterium RIFOXYD2_FULL_50_16]|uniref:Uncharacterized protein n=1 Tax=Candidatus Lambdaproteobacteria bacterium RIFOXYD2_FULL_50_16 TaxID=1817772 RepID=A0A1F6GAC5_9PROT|nr:MAG: hypothetical protein A2527_10135 [Candidatus Lambdaproteobacteria bacterium RIFOXYD2_FULL_50_16]